MKIEDNLILEKQDLDYMMGAYLRSYFFYHNGVPPKFIEIPMVPGVKNYRDPKGEMIPVKFVEFKSDVVTPQEVLELPAEQEEVVPTDVNTLAHTTTRDNTIVRAPRKKK